MMSLVIPAPKPSDADELPIKNTYFWPDVDLKSLRASLRYEGTVTAERLRQAVKTAISEVNAELYDYRTAQMDAGYLTLAEVPADRIDGESIKLTHYEAAVCALTGATIVERYRGYDASGTRKAEEINVSADELWRDARFSISKIAGRSACIIGLL
ncbi:head completion/stabilization protein [Rouxiella silvae]|uniref:Head completion/stabilization protein n=2 Tax=Rouxiella silvae TaxID=1646373 RepID=A0AA40X072_9GAMM|nr:head completion/stabilization protein [Rouxiella silvae]MBF6636201.1 head completion/stabilization protein [Rouxiella silvae]